MVPSLVLSQGGNVRGCPEPAGPYILAVSLLHHRHFAQDLMEGVNVQIRQKFAGQMAEPADSSQATHIHQTHQFNILKLLAAKLAIHVLDDAEQRLLMICDCEHYCTKASHIPLFYSNLVEQGTRARRNHAPMTRHTGLATDEDQSGHKVVRLSTVLALSFQVHFSHTEALHHCPLC